MSNTKKSDYDFVDDYSPCWQELVELDGITAKIPLSPFL